MSWLLYYILISFAGLWPLHHFSGFDLSKPLIFIAAYVAIFTFVWLISYFINREYFIKVVKLVNLIVFFIKESITANLWVAYDIITPRSHINAAIIAIPLDIKSDFEINTLASLITLTPGTLSLQVSDDRKILYVHEMYVKGKDIDSCRKSIKNGFEKRIMEITA